ncbi:MAG TPA: glycoside hydrolase family protein [Dinghuibacter sp.]|uniref:glycoside hydrolase family protein n=1 Tax=Dinghuibacter sp. TaxID=2024697 RepID=UPI002B94019A|nr:glycoside hydrolase family protein [Dinghuibacter sp.]HTJ14134.1 glycoside hydrolase family protein [Dinghuibacter sp.]
MQKSHFLLASVLLLAACSKNGGSNGSGLPGQGGQDTTSKTQTDTAHHSAKKGADFSTNNTNGTWDADVAALNDTWFYTWGTPQPTGAPKNVEFVPMFWGGANVTSANISLVQQMKTSGAAKYVLGFNEPDQSGQSNMTVSQALALWPQLETIGLPLGSPAVSYPTVAWFTQFMDSVAAEHLRVDFICVHMYVGTDDNNFVQTLETLYSQYHLPIWITEFATADWNATSTSNNMYTAAQVQSFMQRLLPRLDTMSFVQRYSWFSGDPTSPQLWPSALFDGKGNLTALGSWYAGH